MKRGQIIGSEPKKPGEPFERRYKQLRKELDRIKKTADDRVRKIIHEYEQRINAVETSLTNLAQSQIDATRLHRVAERGWIGRILFRLRYLFTGSI